MRSAIMRTNDLSAIRQAFFQFGHLIKERAEKVNKLGGNKVRRGLLESMYKNRYQVKLNFSVV